MSECRRGFKFLEHTADVYFEARGKTLEEVFEEAARAMFSVITDISRVEKKIKRRIEGEGIDLFNALYRWLEELLILHDAEGLVFSEFSVEYVRDEGEVVKFSGEALGEPFDEKKHERGTEVKAVTYSMMEIGKDNGCWYARVVLDI